MTPDTETTTAHAGAVRTTSLLRRVTDDLVQLLSREMALARSEANDKVESLVGGIVTMLAGALLAHAALIILLIAVVTALDEVMPSWAAALIVGGIVAVIGFLLVRQGERSLEGANLMPRRTIQNLRADARVLKEQLQ